MITPENLRGKLYMRRADALPQSLSEDCSARATNRFTCPPQWAVLPGDDPYKGLTYLFQGQDGSIWDLKAGEHHWRKRV